MNRIEAISFLGSFFAGLKKKPSEVTELKPFLDFLLSLKRDLPLAIPLLRDLAAFASDRKDAPPPPHPARDAEGIVEKRIGRRYRRLCRVQEELGRLDLKKAAPGVSPEDYVFSRIDFSRYRQIDEKDFERFFLEGLEDFSPEFFRKNFGLERKEARTVIEGSYQKTDGVYRVKKETPLVLSLTRTLETSLETLPLFHPGETEEELKNLLAFLEGAAGQNRAGRKLLPGMEGLFSRLVPILDGVSISHGDGMTTKLFIPDNGGLSGTFRPGNKPWTLTLIPAEMIGGLVQ